MAAEVRQNPEGRKLGGARRRRLFSTLSVTIPPRTFETILGVIIALLACEVALRPFAAGLPNLPVPSSDYQPSRSLPGPGREIRQYLEGFATSHFAPDGARLTGQAVLANAPVGLVLGDSFVEAAQVDDLSTLGAVVERLSRGQGRPLNIRQYGWSGAGIPTYLALAERMQREWHPDWITIILNKDDLGTEGLDDGLYYHMKIHPDGSYDLVEVERTASKMQPLLRRVGLTPNDLRSAMETSTVAFLCVQRYQLMAANSGAQPAALTTVEETQSAETRRRIADETATRVAMRGLKDRYGSHLVILYVPDIDLAAGKQPDRNESELLQICTEMNMTCLSTRDAMLYERDTNHRLAQGFSNSVLGRGHLNEDGHSLVGSVIWRVVSALEEPVNGR